MVKHDYTPYYTHRFNGLEHEVVHGSRRDQLLWSARSAAAMGFPEAIDYHLMAMRAPGCAHEHRLGVQHG